MSYERIFSPVFFFFFLNLISLLVNLILSIGHASHCMSLKIQDSLNFSYPSSSLCPPSSYSSPLVLAFCSAVSNLSRPPSWKVGGPLSPFKTPSFLSMSIATQVKRERTAVSRSPKKMEATMKENNPTRATDPPA